MEKEIKSKKVSNTDKKLSYEQLEQVAANLNQQCRNQQQAIQELQRALSELSEIGTLLNILDKGQYFKKEFTARCADVIEKLITKALDDSEKQAEEKGEKK